MVGVGGSGKLTITGALTNAADGLITVRSSSKMTLNQGLSVNDGIITNNEGYFDNNNHTMTNNGRIISNGTFSTAGLTNTGAGRIYFNGAVATSPAISPTIRAAKFTSSMIRPISPAISPTTASSRSPTPKSITWAPSPAAIPATRRKVISPTW